MMVMMLMEMDVVNVKLIIVDSGKDYLEIVQNVGMEFLRKEKNVMEELDVMQVVK